MFKLPQKPVETARLNMQISHTPTPRQKSTVQTNLAFYETMVLAVALSYLQVGGRTPTVL